MREGSVLRKQYTRVLLDGASSPVTRYGLVCFLVVFDLGVGHSLSLIIAIANGCDGLGGAFATVFVARDE
jgi:hypothetical protein